MNYCRTCAHVRWHLELAHHTCSLRRVEFEAIRPTNCTIHVKKGLHRADQHRKTS